MAQIERFSIGDNGSSSTETNGPSVSLGQLLPVGKEKNTERTRVYGYNTEITDKKKMNKSKIERRIKPSTSYGS